MKIVFFMDHLNIHRLSEFLQLKLYPTYFIEIIKEKTSNIYILKSVNFFHINFITFIELIYTIKSIGVRVTKYFEYRWKKLIYLNTHK